MIKSLTATFGMLFASVATPALADTLIANANGIQVDANGKLERFTGILIGNDGKVKRLLHGEMLKLRDTDVVDAKGKTVLPGLIDAHGHVTALGFAALQLDLTGTTSIEDLQSRLKAYAAANPDARWILGRGWNQELWTEKRFPTSADLDAVVSDRPVWLGRVDGHAAIANSAAMQAAGFALNTQAPSGGRIENGLFVDAAMSMIESRIPAPTPAEQDAALAAAQRLMLSNGLTTAADMGTTPDEWLAMNRAGKANALNVRVLSYAGGIPGMRAINSGKPTGWLYNDRLHLGGVKLYADGALGSRGAWLKHPYHDKVDTRGLQFLTDAQMLEQANAAASGGYQLAIHAIGDAANAQVISTYEKISATYGKDRRWRIEHFQIADPVDIPRLKSAGIIASMQPTHQTSDRLMAEARLGHDRLKGAYAWQTVEKLGIPIAFGSDFPVESPNPFPGLAAAVSRQDMNAQPPGGWIPEERVTFEQALAGFTRGAAYAGFAETKIGTLDAGKWADFIIVDRDVSTVDPQTLGRTQVLETWVAGKKAWSKAASVGAERGR
ncbi:amidohydrolase family protein [Sphingomonas sp. NSE70-1]|uniref:Amidohydrolase family protein n=1 Tax=Sphingomonas caseinilyticus TaxID=2908205 RepID=A0ABT0RXH8_9SPHN|nr:amidohydrolase [Sphingomonas caseinilyticus]MCL6699420.1 amidohydrolase family protein [Sphingomonas caseinilyticus]